MLVLAFLRGAVVITRHTEHGVRACVLGKLRQGDGFERVVGTGTGDHRHTLPRHLDANLDDTAMLFMAEGRRLARGADGNKPVAAFGNLPLHQFGERVLINLSIPKRCDKSDERTLEHFIKLQKPPKTAGGAQDSHSYPQRQGNRPRTTQILCYVSTLATLVSMLVVSSEQYLMTGHVRQTFGNG